MAFVLIAHSIFGPELYNYSTLTLSIRTCVFLLLGQLDYEGLQSVNGFWAPVFSISYFLVMNFTCINLLLATTAYIYEELRLVYYKSYEKVENENRRRHPSAVDETLYSVTLWDLVLTMAPIVKDLMHIVRPRKKTTDSKKHFQHE